MKYKFLDNIATADAAFEAYGKDLPELFANCAEALTEVMVDSSSLSERSCQTVNLSSCQADNLLYDFLTELIFLKDTEGFLVKRSEITMKPFNHETMKLEANCFGDKIDPSKHEFKVDVKAVTMHEFGIKKTKEGYKARVVLDV